MMNEAKNTLHQALRAAITTNVASGLAVPIKPVQTDAR
jgi:hypothetical protein